MNDLFPSDERARNLAAIRRHALPEFTVTIPEERDQPGRVAWAYVRLAMAGWEELAVYNIRREDATPVEWARIALAEALFTGDPRQAPQRLEALLAKA